MDDRRMSLLAAAAVCGLLGASNAAAVENGFYAGISAGQAEHDIERSDMITPADDVTLARFSASLDSKSTAFSAFAGWQVGRWFAVEGSLGHLGSYDYRTAFALQESPTELWEFDTRADFTIRAATISALLTIPMGESFVAGLRAGAAYSTFELDTRTEFWRNGALEVTDRGDDSRKNLAPVYGVSLEYLPTRRFSLRLDWQAFRDVGKEDEFKGINVDTLALSALMRF